MPTLFQLHPLALKLNENSMNTAWFKKEKFWFHLGGFLCFNKVLNYPSMKFFLLSILMRYNSYTEQKSQPVNELFPVVWNKVYAKIDISSDIF